MPHDKKKSRSLFYRISPYIIRIGFPLGLLTASILIFISGSFDSSLVPILLPLAAFAAGILVTRPWDAGILIFIRKALKCRNPFDIRNLEFADKIFRSSSEGFIVTDEKCRIVSINPAFTTITGYSGDDVLQKSPGILKSGKHDAEFYSTMWKSINSWGKWEGEIWDRKKNGELFPQWLFINEVTDEKTRKNFYVGIFHDISSLKAREAVVEYNSYYDRLTDLPNKHLFMDRLKLALTQRERTGFVVCLMVIDLENFKEVNDVIGFALGDQLIRESAFAISSEIRRGDTLARTENHEFSLILTQIQHAEEASEIAERILSAFRNGFSVNGTSIYVSLSIGISLSPDDGLDSKTLLKCADLALLRAKSRDRNAYHFFTADLNVRAQKRFALETSLRQAVADEGMNLYFQPILDLESGKIAGSEALVRMFDVENVAISPSQFIPVAEETGLILPLGEWVLRKACTAVEVWQYKQPDMHIAVNLSARQFLDTDLFHKMKTIFHETGINPEQLNLEITENSIIQDFDESIKILSGLKDLGVKISIDDFGTGYSSLVYLKKLPIDILKIDRSFIQDIRKGSPNPLDSAIVTAIISMAHKLGLSVVAEGIENFDQLDFLRNNSCNFGQGYLFSQPVPGSTMEKYLEHRNYFESRIRAIVAEGLADGN